MAVKPTYETLHSWEDYGSSFLTEYKQSIEEGLDISQYEEFFKAACRLPAGEFRAKVGDAVYNLVSNAKTVDGYKYNEPSELEEIKALRKKHPLSGKVNRDTLFDKIYGAWMGRIAGCYLGKAVEGIKSDELIPFLKKSGNYPMTRYISSADCTDTNLENIKYPVKKNVEYLESRKLMAYDDDTNYVVLAQVVVEKYSKEFTPCNMMEAWLWYQPKDAYCTAERRAFINFTRGFTPPASASYKNPYREWIGAQIRGDYFGYINPGNPEKAAEMAWRDACISHVKNGIYGEMFASSMIAAAAVCDNIKDVILAGLAEIPQTSRLYEDVMSIVNMYDSGKTWEDVTNYIHEKWDEYSPHGWCHTISNAMVCAMALLYGEGDFGKSICLAVQTCFDTDCNGATVGSVIGMIKGFDGIEDVWKAPFDDTLETTIFGMDKVKISECAEKTMKH
ncbi:MAG: ADP-ribosylglycohydrolase family protein, partial [Oscillospiraceae bacterium]|nr:ADP-ribosylglycohydrolase family protein [Oscillospiraceae bacterium]